jgi:hypothetical protein
LNSLITKQNKECVTLGPNHLHLKNILKQKKKIYENSNISPCKNIYFKKSFKTNQNPSIYYNEGGFFPRGRGQAGPRPIKGSIFGGLHALLLKFYSSLTHQKMVEGVR